MVQEKIKQIIEEVRAIRNGKERRQVRYSSRVKRRILDLISEGIGVNEIERLTGINDWTIRQWQKKIKKEERCFNELVIVNESRNGDIKAVGKAEVARHEIILRGQSGIEIYGLGFEEVRALIAGRAI
jgi:hypothetical protein